MFHRKVVLYPDSTVVKSGKRIAMGEAEALKVAALVGIPAPRLLGTNSTTGRPEIRMSYIRGQTLESLCPSMTVDQKKDIARQLRIIVGLMRSVAPPTKLIGSCNGTEIRDTRVHFTYHSAPCRDEKAFNEFLKAALYEPTPPLVREAFHRRLRTDHCIVLSHCDLTPRNIIVEDGRIQGLVNREDSGWYPEYWEYVKFFQRATDKDWKLYAQEIFSELYHDDWSMPLQCQSIIIHS